MKKDIPGIDLFDGLTCRICKRHFSAYGVYNHSMAHVRKGEATQHVNPLTWIGLANFPYIFKVVTP
jgi:hypothetical protein